VAAMPMLTRRHAVIVACVSDPVLDAAASNPAESSPDALAALSVLAARESASTRIRRLGAEVLLAPGGSLPERCVQAYLRAKARARL
jgi:uncharacterized protein (DUF58 family)